MRKITSLLFLLVSILTATAQDNVYGFDVTDDIGQQTSLEIYRGKVLLIVNTATRCGFTPQYKDLQALYAKYREMGFEVLDFPCNQFGSQAPGTIKEIHQFCTANFDITFPQFDKIEVNGAGESPLYTYLKREKGFGGFDLNDRTGKLLDDMMTKKDPNYAKDPSIKWNFTKFLIGTDGRVLSRYEPTAPMELIEAGIQKALGINEVISTILSRRSIRKYKDTPVEHEKLETIVRCGINAPSGMNAQPWLVRVVENQSWIKGVTEVYKKANPTQVERDPDFKNMFRNAPNVICVSTPKGRGAVDAGLMGENMMLAAHSLGLGTCCLGAPVRFLTSTPEAKPFLDQLDIPADYEICFFIAVGYPDESPEAKPRDEKKVKFIP